LVYFTAIRYILRSFGIFCGTLVLFSPCWWIVPRKIWQPWRGRVCLPMNKGAHKCGRNIERSTSSHTVSQPHFECLDDLKTFLLKMKKCHSHVHSSSKNP
jgi:hypothetical protein